MASWEECAVSTLASREAKIMVDTAGELTSGRKVHPIRERKPDILRS